MSAAPQRQAEWGSLGARLAAEIPDFLPPLDELLPMTDQPRLVHADLTRDHLLGALTPGRLADGGADRLRRCAGGQPLVRAAGTAPGPVQQR